MMLSDYAMKQLLALSFQIIAHAAQGLGGIGMGSTFHSYA
jgi:hypothetical protein